MSRFDDSVFSSQKDIHAYLAKHGDKVISIKKNSVKHADAFSGLINCQESAEAVAKAVTIMDNPPDIFHVKAVINTTNLYDSHGDVHIDGLWNKSQKEGRFIQHLQEHGNKFTDVIAEGDSLKVSVENTTFEKLGSKYSGATQALIFDSEVDRDVNEYMWKLYSKGRVNQHSVGMRYVRMLTAMDNKDYAEEYANFKKYIDLVANKDDIKNGYFYPVLEAKVLEGSAVTRGSNHVTPTLSNQPGKSLTGSEPELSTRRKLILYC